MSTSDNGARGPRSFPTFGFIICGLLSVTGCQPTDVEPALAPEVSLLKETILAIDLPLGLPPMQMPGNNQMTTEKIALGKKLFFDPVLSVDQTISCSSCHDPQQGWSNGTRVAEGVQGRTGNRNSPTILNAAYNKKQFWDGRARSLEHQALMPILNPDEMGMESEADIVERLVGEPEYVELFGEAFEDGLTANNVARAIACFERTIVMGDTPFDRYEAGDKTAMSESAVRGMKLFFNDRKGNCGSCHAKPLLSDQEFHNIGVGMDQPDPDLGFHVTLGFGFEGAFRSPSLRGVVSTAPYMHDGSMKTLEEVIEYYVKGGNPNAYMDAGMRPLRLRDEELADLIQFLKEGLGTYDGSEFDSQIGGELEGELEGE